jgi:hypothetical protein
MKTQGYHAARKQNKAATVSHLMTLDIIRHQTADDLINVSDTFPAKKLLYSIRSQCCETFSPLPWHHLP